MSIDIESALETRFEGLSVQELQQIGKDVGVHLPGTMKPETMRGKLLEKLIGAPAESIQPLAPVVQTTARSRNRFDPKPILTSIDGWGGKRWHVIVNPPYGESENDPNKFSLSWEGHKRLFPYNEELNLPHPYMMALKDAVKQNCVQKEAFDAENKFTHYNNHWTPTPRHSHHSVRPVPGTEMLPESLREYWQIQAAKHDNFKGVERRLLIEIYSDLYQSKGKDFYKQLTDQDILIEILNFLDVDETLAA